jgi:hypothetical protein
MFILLHDPSIILVVVTSTTWGFKPHDKTSQPWLQAASFYFNLRIHVGISILGIVNIDGVGNGEDKVGLIDIGASELALGLPFTPTPYFNLKPWYSKSETNLLNHE